MAPIDKRKALDQVPNKRELFPNGGQLNRERKTEAGMQAQSKTSNKASPNDGKIRTKAKSLKPELEIANYPV